MRLAKHPWDLWSPAPLSATSTSCKSDVASRPSWLANTRCEQEWLPRCLQPFHLRGEIRCGVQHQPDNKQRAAVENGVQENGSANTSFHPLPTQHHPGDPLRKDQQGQEPERGLRQIEVVQMDGRKGQ